MKKRILATVVAMLAFPAAFAHEPGDTILRIGAVHVSPDESNGPVKYSSTNPSEPPDRWGWRARVSSDTQFGLTATWIVAPHFGIELMASTPSSHTINDGSGKFVKFKQSSPTVSAQYFFLPSKFRFQPYVGLGVNYTRFDDVKSTGWAKEEDWKFKFKNSWGLAGQVGLDFAITDKLVLNTAVWRVDVNTKMTAKNPEGSYTETRKTKIDLDPWVYFVGIGYKF